jgi:hypothetical protein
MLKVKPNTIPVPMDDDTRVEQHEVEGQVPRAFHSAQQTYAMNRKHLQLVAVEALMAYAWITSFPPDATAQQIADAIVARRMPMPLPTRRGVAGAHQ